MNMNTSQALGGRIYTLENRPFDYVVIVDDRVSIKFTAYPVKVDDGGQLYVIIEESTTDEDGDRCELRLYLDMNLVEEVENMPMKIGFNSFELSDCECVEVKV